MSIGKVLGCVAIAMSILIPLFIILHHLCQSLSHVDSTLRVVTLPRSIPSHITRHEGRTTLPSGGVGPMLEVE